ncbi:barstar family protein [Kitasatospora sp. NPDC051853]|uniref:barstar family protein n=1 Tax=Kitasatospora sp. NPDC051853 TaxID=3364058 RepID=UPI00379FC9E7
MARYALVDSESGEAWGTCDEVTGLSGEDRRRTYELSGWLPAQDGATPGWLGDRVWLVPEGPGRPDPEDPWLLGDVLTLGVRSGALAVSAFDDYLSPPEDHDGPVRLNDGHRWLGTCRGVTRIVPAPRPSAPVVLSGLAPSERLLAALAKGTRRSLYLDEAYLEIRDDHGDLLTHRLMWPTVTAWHPSSAGAGLIDLELDAGPFEPLPDHARPLLERWLAGPPDAPGAWVDLNPRDRQAWLDLVREHGCCTDHHPRPPGQAYELDGRHITDAASLYLALGEAVNGPGGYFGANTAAVDDCLCGSFGHTSPATLLWRHSATAREHLSAELDSDGGQYDLFAVILEIMARHRVTVTLA